MNNYDAILENLLNESILYFSEDFRYKLKIIAKNYNMHNNSLNQQSKFNQQ